MLNLCEQRKSTALPPHIGVPLAVKRFIYAVDHHYGYERINGHKVPLHDAKAWRAVLAFAKDFKPDEFILGGDVLDCGSISHHNKNKPGNVEGMRLVADAAECYRDVIAPIEAICKNNTLLIGNHESWIDDLITELPALDGIINIDKLLKLEKWRIVPQGGAYNLGKLTFVHGDTVRGGEHVAKAAVINYERNIRFGHHHSFQVYTKCSAIDYKNAKTGILVPCLCSKTPKYGEGAPNRWTEGFLFGYIHPNGTFNDYVAIILDGQCTVNGVTYRG